MEKFSILINIKYNFKIKLAGMCNTHTNK